MSQLVIVLSGRKQSGKSSTSNYIVSKYLNHIQTDSNYHVSDLGELYEDDKLVDPVTLQSDGIKLYSFADPLKEFCVNVFGAEPEQCYGTDAQKDTIIPHLLWENTPKETRPITKVFHQGRYVEFAGKVSEDWTEEVTKTGPMTGRELMQWFGTDICRKIYGDIWAQGTYTKIVNDGFKIAIVTDGRFPNEIILGKGVDAKTVRLLRAAKEDSHKSESALDNFPLKNFTCCIDNRAMSLEAQFEAIDPFVNQWFREAGIV